MIIKDIGFLAAFWGGFSSFFSIWQLCLMQITPFFMAFSVGLYLVEYRPLPLGEGRGEGSAMKSLLLACIGYILGFSIVFALMGTSGWWTAAYILYNIEDFRMAAAIYLTAIGVLMVLNNIYRKGKRIQVFCLPAGLLLGASFAVAYSPCIPPVMSDIMNFAGKPGNAHRGFHLLAVYGFGLTLAFAVTGVVISTVIGNFAQEKPTRNAIIAASCGALLIMAFLLITDLMIRYKSFLVGLVLD